MRKTSRILAMVLLVSILLSLCACLKFSGNLITAPAAHPTAATPYRYEGQEATAPYSVPVPTQPYIPVPQPTVPVETQPAAEQPTQPAVVPTQPATQPVTQAPSTPDPSSWDTAKVVSYLQECVNKSKDFMGQVTVEHTEAFQIEITKIPGGSLVKNLANSIVSGVTKPTNETLQYNGGQATNSEKETVPLLLPKRQKFNLPVSGVKSATAAKSGQNIEVNITLVQELSSLGQTPQYNSGAVGYLSTDDVDLSLVTVEKLEITYFGSTIKAIVNPDGYVLSAEYHIPINVYGSGRAIGISGEFECEGEEVEVWKVNW